MKAITTRSGVAYEGPSIPTNPSPKKVVERETEETTDKEQTNFQGSTTHIQPSVTPILEPNVPKTLPKPNIPYPSRFNDQKLREKSTNQMEKFFQIFQDFHFDISFADALLLMPKFASTIKSLLTNKDKLFELAKIPLNENCSAMLLKNLPENLRDPGKFLIPCDFSGMDLVLKVVLLCSTKRIMFHGRLVFSGNLNGYNAVQNVKNQVAQNPRVQNVGNQNGLIGVPGNANQNENGNLVAARAEGNAAGHNGIQLQAKEFDLMAAAADLDEIKEVNANYILMANLQQASTSGTQTDKAPVYDSDGSAEVHDYENFNDNEIFNMFTQEEQYTKLLEPIPEIHQVPQNDNNIISEVTSVEQNRETVEQGNSRTISCKF
nr:reverse transcriptase domain-containing protein [Tanacetum cinerariifolium]